MLFYYMNNTLYIIIIVLLVFFIFFRKNTIIEGNKKKKKKKKEENNVLSVLSGDKDSCEVDLTNPTYTYTAHIKTPSTINMSTKSKSINKTKFYYDIYWQDMRIWGTTALILVHLSRLVKNITLKNV